MFNFYDLLQERQSILIFIQDLMTKYQSIVRQMWDCILLDEHSTVNKDLKDRCSMYLRNLKTIYYDFLIIILVFRGYL